MAVWQVESGEATGRGFAGVDADGLLAKFATWVVKSGANGGPGWYLHDDQSALAIDPYIVVCDTQTPAVNDLATGPGGLPPKFIKIGMKDTQAGYIQIQYYMWWDNTTQTGRGLWAGWILMTLDSGTFAYSFRGGVEGIVVHTRVTGQSRLFISGVLDWEGDANLVEATSKYGVLTAEASAGSSVTLNLDTGQAANFTVGKFYFIYDFSVGTLVNYVKVTAKDELADTIVVETLASTFATGSVISPYAHRHTAFGTTGYANAKEFSLNYSGQVANYCCIPYVSSLVATNVVHDQDGYITIQAKFDYLANTLLQIAPDDYNMRAVMRPIIGELYCANSNATTYDVGMNRAYGQVKNLYIAYNNSRSLEKDGLTVNAKNYVYLAHVSDLNINASSVYDLLFLDTEST